MRITAQRLKELGATFLPPLQGIAVIDVIRDKLFDSEEIEVCGERWFVETRRSLLITNTNDFIPVLIRIMGPIRAAKELIVFVFVDEDAEVTFQRTHIKPRKGGEVHAVRH